MDRKELYQQLTDVFNANDEPDLSKVERIATEIVGYPPKPFVPHIFDGLAACILAKADLQEETHRLRAIWRFARWDRAEYSRVWIANRKEED